MAKLSFEVVKGRKIAWPNYLVSKQPGIGFFLPKAASAAVYLIITTTLLSSSGFSIGIYCLETWTHISMRAVLLMPTRDSCRLSKAFTSRKINFSKLKRQLAASYYDQLFNSFTQKVVTRKTRSPQVTTPKKSVFVSVKQTFQQLP